MLQSNGTVNGRQSIFFLSLFLDGSQKRMCLFQLSFPLGSSSSAAITHSHSLIYSMINCWWTKTHMKMMPQLLTLSVSRHRNRICLQTDGWFVSFVMFLCMFSFIHSWKCRHTCKHPLYFDCSAAVAATTSHFSVTVWMIENREKTSNSFNPWRWPVNWVNAAFATDDDCCCILLWLDLLRWSLSYELDTM